MVTRRRARTDYSRLGYVQSHALARLADRPGQTTADLEDLSSGQSAGVRRSAVANAMRLLQGRGLAVTTRKIPPADGHGKWLNVWEPTEAGRALVRRTT